MTTDYTLAHLSGNGVARSHGETSGKARCSTKAVAALDAVWQEVRGQTSTLIVCGAPLARVRPFGAGSFVAEWLTAAGAWTKDTIADGTLLDGRRCTYRNRQLAKRALELACPKLL